MIYQKLLVLNGNFSSQVYKIEIAACQYSIGLYFLNIPFWYCKLLYVYSSCRKVLQYTSWLWRSCYHNANITIDPYRPLDDLHQTVWWPVRTILVLRSIWPALRSPRYNRCILHVHNTPPLHLKLWAAQSMGYLSEWCECLPHLSRWNRQPCWQEVYKDIALALVVTNI